MYSMDFSTLDNSSMLSLLRQTELQKIEKDANKRLLSYHLKLEDLVNEFINKNGYGIKSDNPKYSTLVNNGDINKLKCHLESKKDILKVL